MRSLQRPSARLTAGRVDMAPWLPQCCTVRPIHAPARPARARGASTLRPILFAGAALLNTVFYIGLQVFGVHLRMASHEHLCMIT
jgi:hypothetical protein